MGTVQHTSSKNSLRICKTSVLLGRIMGAFDIDSWPIALGDRVSNNKTICLLLSPSFFVSIIATTHTSKSTCYEGIFEELNPPCFMAPL